MDIQTLSKSTPLTLEGRNPGTSLPSVGPLWIYNAQPE